MLIVDCFKSLLEKLENVTKTNLCLQSKIINILTFDTYCISKDHGWDRAHSDVSRAAKQQEIAIALSQSNTLDLKFACQHIWNSLQLTVAQGGTHIFSVQDTKAFRK